MPVVLDASAILAVLKGEDGAERVREALHTATPTADGYPGLVSALNVTEVYEQLGAGEQAWEQFALLEPLVDVVPYASDQTKHAASLKAPTRYLGLSLADCACLALARITGAAALTADAAWDDIAEIAGVRVIQVSR